MGACSSRDIENDLNGNHTHTGTGPDDLGIRKLTQGLKHLS